MGLLRFLRKSPPKHDKNLYERGDYSHQGEPHFTANARGNQESPHPSYLQDHYPSPSSQTPPPYAPQQPFNAQGYAAQGHSQGQTPSMQPMVNHDPRLGERYMAESSPLGGTPPYAHYPSQPSTPSYTPPLSSNPPPPFPKEAAPSFRSFNDGRGDYVDGSHTRESSYARAPVDHHPSLQGGAQQTPFFSATAANYSSPQHGSSDLRELRFWDNGPIGDDASEEKEEDAIESQPLRFILALAVLIIFAAFAWLVFRWSTQSVSTTPPHIQTDPTPFKVRPDQPGGLVVPHQDKLVYGRIDMESNIRADQNVERLLPPAEQPMQPQVYPPTHPQMQPPQGYGPPQGGYSGNVAPVGTGNQQYAPYPPAPQQNYNHPQHQAMPQQGGYYPQAQGGYPPAQGYPSSPPPGEQTYGQQQAYVSPPMDPNGYHQGNVQGQMHHPQQAAMGQRVHGYDPQQGAEDREEGEGPFYPDNTVNPAHNKPHSYQQPQPPAHIQQGHMSAQNQSYQVPSRQLQSDESAELPTGFLGAAPPSTLTHTRSNAITPSFYKAKLASLETKAAAEKEWDRLKTKNKEPFKNLNKAIVKETKNGRTFFVVYALGLQGDEAAKIFCKKIGNCTYHKQ